MSHLNYERSCPACEELRNTFYGYQIPEPGKLSDPCLHSPPWFSWGCEQHTHQPRNFACQQVGSYCNMYVCVPPEGRDMLTRLTLAILDYAVNDPEQYTKRTKQVDIYLNAKDEPTNASNAVKIIRATIPIDQPSGSLVTFEESAAYSEFWDNFKEEQLDALLKYADTLKKNHTLDETSGPEALDFWRDPGFQAALKEMGVDEKLLKFIAEKAILPKDIPSEKLLKGPASFLKQGEVSSGLQMLEQRLRAAAP